MNKIVLVEIFKTTIGKIAILEFPDNSIPKIRMILRNVANSEWKITGIGQGKHTTKTLWGCQIKNNSVADLKIGDLLFI
jgi:hypothetical protein